MRNTLILRCGLVTAGIWVAPLCAAAEPATRPTPASAPNIILILADDLGARDLTGYGSTFHETPHLDRLAARGVRFASAYSAANVCSPTRASLLTGRHPARIGITDWLPGRASQPTDRLRAPTLPSHLRASDLTFAEAFRAAGYRTAFIGKWHVGDTPDHFPDRHGFDLNIGGSGKGHPPSYFSPYRLPNFPDGPPGEHLDDRLTREAIDYLRTAAATPRPFLLYLAHYAVHTPLQAPPELVAKYTDKLAGRPDPSPDFSEDGPDGRVRIRQTNPTYAAMVESLDRSVGRLLDALDELGLAANTLVIFTSDNGGLSTAERSPTANTPLRAGKGWAYEGGVRVPLIVSWPGRLPTGATTEAVVSSTDFFPTMLELAGLPLQPEAHLDGRSFAAVLRNPAATPADRSIYWHYPHYSNQRGRPHSALRHGPWKLIEWLEDNRVELFNLAADPAEAHDLAATEPARAAELLTELHAWRRDLGARLPVPNPAFNSAR